MELPAQPGSKHSFQPGETVAPRGQLPVSGDILDSHNWGTLVAPNG